ncbi:MULTISPECIES: class I SAM-dependent methyltransferase [unclassified Methylobacterium]|jgi:Methyltransferase domain|uniref:class I SAM-dependent methyltransferase n=1 Tax=unclassified Methylobacterium TaxID=2615210 RepID=UPI0013708C5B|nr:class I SAM-dependent methyltransferase [Methylobacterium sp. 2A]
MNKIVLSKHYVSYYRCENCLSCQTEEPYWLPEAYKSSAINLDVGMCQRTLNCVLQTSLFLSEVAFGHDELCIDFGGHIGLFTRMMRDRGFNFISYDKFSQPIYSGTFSANDLSELTRLNPSLVTVYEVLEHLPNPAVDLNEIFSLSSKYIISSTEIYESQGKDWWYFVPDGGQHVFFYSLKALALVAEKYGFVLRSFGSTHIFIAKAEIAVLAARGINIDEVIGRIANPRYALNKSLDLLGSHQQQPWTWIQRDFETVSDLLKKSAPRRAGTATETGPVA